MALNTAKATALLKDLTRTFILTAQGVTPLYPSLCTVIPSDGADEKYGGLGNMPGMREWLGDRKFEELSAATFTIDNRHWESSLAVKKTDLADDRMGLYGPLAQNMAIEAISHPDELLFEAIKNGETKPGFDGQYFFDTDHSWGDSGVQSNDLSAIVGTATAPTAVEFRKAFHSARSAMLQFKNDRGKLLYRPSIKGMTNLVLLVHPDLEVTAKEALTATILNNNSNVVIDAPQIVATGYLTDPTKFYLLNMGSPMRPFIFQAREPLSPPQTKGLDDLETKDVKFMVEARYNIGYFAWWNAVLTTFGD